MNNHTWELVNLLFESKLLGHKWIFKRKIKVYDTIGKYKDGLVVKGLNNKNV